MRHLDIMIPERWMISEAKARIDHPEDLVFDERSAGASKALNAMSQAAKMPHTVTIKWDGSPALIFGRDDQGYTLTDKSGFSNMKPTGTPRSAAELNNMLFMRKPNDPSRQDYAASIASLWPQLQRILPKDFSGYLQADLLWNGVPEVVDGNYVFRPNKISYSIPVDSPLGQRIGRSQAGLTLHTIYDDRADEEGRAIGDINQMGLIDNPNLVVMGPEIKELQHTHLSPKLMQTMQALIKKSAAGIDEFLNPTALSQNGITDLPDRLKSYVAKRANTGTIGLDDAPQGFVKWIQDPTTNITDRKRANMLKWINDHKVGYSATWAVANQLLKLKDLIKKDIDRQVIGTGGVGAVLRDIPGHEGYVADTPSGKIKFVDRPHFMKKD